MVVVEADIRQEMSIVNVAEISTGLIDSKIADATKILVNKTDDETAIKYFTCYLLAKGLNWTTISKSGDVSFNKRDPNTYFDLYKFTMDSIEEGLTDDLPGSMLLNDPKVD